MRLLRCRQCGAATHDGKACAEHLYEWLLADSPCRADNLEVAALFALKHPTTHSEECLQLAREYLARARSQRAAEAPGYAPTTENSRASAAAPQPSLSVALGRTLCSWSRRARHVH
jgi:Tfp pilus assembly protein PilV